VAKIVAAYAVPHTPSFVADVAQTGASHEAARFFASIKSHLDQANADTLVLIQNDHFNTFFFNNWPTFAIGVAKSADGPSDQTPSMQKYQVEIEQSLASLLLEYLVTAGFDFSASHELSLDHGVLVPLHFLTPEMKRPIVPIFINCLMPPLPLARRCYALGQALNKAIETWPVDSRIAVIASGSLSLEVGGPLIEPGKTFGVPDRKWAARVLEFVKNSQHSELLDEATPVRMAQAGNVGGELLNWIALLGIVGSTQPDIVIEQPALGNAFAAWRLDGANS
jgi:protocatechuate 4,5-dioxygenase beta chain